MENRTILLVEDNPKDEMLTLRALRKGNLANRIDVVRDGAEALDYLFGTGDHADRQGAELPTVVLLDLNLPKLNGLEVLRRLRADSRTRFLSVVVLTSSDDDKDILASYELRANSYVRKPVTFCDFSQAVANLGHYWLVTNEPLPPKR